MGNPMISKRVAMMWLAVLRAYAVRYWHPNLAAAQIARGKRTNTNLPISTIAYALGLNDPAYFSRLFSGATSLSPRSFATNSIVGREQQLSGRCRFDSRVSSKFVTVGSPACVA